MPTGAHLGLEGTLMKHLAMAAALLLPAALSLSAFGLNYNASKSNTGNYVLVHTSTVTEAQAAAILAEMEKSHRTPTEAALRSLMTAKGVKQGTMKLIIEQQDGKNVVLMLDDPSEEKKARGATNPNSSRSNISHN
jgi:hypothetical protein